MKPTTIDFEKNIGAALFAASNRLEKALNTKLGEHGITFRQSQVIGCLMIQPGLTQIELAQWLQLEAPTIARVLDRMERDGWVVRESHPDDRRKKMMQPTAAAEDAWKLMRRVSQEVFTTATSGLSKSQIDALLTGMRIIRTNLGEAKRDESE